MDKTMRLQCRITPATKELHAHLEEMEPDYRAKRLVTMAAMYLSIVSSGEEVTSRTAAIDSTTINNEKTQKNSSVRPVASWIRGANV